MKNKNVSKFLIAFLSCLITASLIVPKTLKAEVSFTDICDTILKKQSIFLDPDLLIEALDGDVWGILQDIYNNTISYKTWKDTVHACEVDPDSVHGGHGGKIPNKVWYTVLEDTENDHKNGNNYNYYTNSNYSTTNNYSVTNSTTNNISYTYENTAYNYYYDVNNSYYDIENNSYNYYLSANNYLTTINNYNNTTIIDNGSNRVLYYRLPDGSNSLNMTEEIALNGYKTSLSVRSYENTYDSDDLVALYHFDGNELDSAYPTQTTLDFTRNSIQYIGSTTSFNESLALYGESTISVNKSGKYTSFRFNPIFSNSWSLNINGTDIGSSSLNYETYSQYDEYYNDYYISNPNSYFYVYYNSSDELYFATSQDSSYHRYYFKYLDSFINYNNSHYVGYTILNFNNSDFDQVSSSVSTTGSTIYLDGLTAADKPEYFQYDYVYNEYFYQKNAVNSNRSYNYVNQYYIYSTSAVNLVNFNMWNFLTVNIDGSVYINGNNTGIDVDNSQNLTISIGGDSVTYIDELALFNSNHNNYSPFYPYSSNIVYSVPEYYEYLELPGIKINQLLQNNNFNNSLSYWNYNNNPSVSVSNNIAYINTSQGYSGLYQNNIQIYNTHKYYICFNIKNNYLCLIGSISMGRNQINSNTDSSFYSFIQTCSTNNNNDYFCIYSGTNNITNIEISNINFIDLTLMFGSGYEPSKEWCDQNLTDYIAYNINPDVTESPYNIETSYTYIKQIPTGLAKNNEILIQSIIPVNNWKIGGYRSSNPSNGDVFCNVDDLGYITSVQQYNGLDWVEVTAGLYNEYMGMWISALGFNIFNQNWEYTEYKYLNDGGSDSWLVRFLSDKFRDTDNILSDILKQVGLINPNIQVNQELNNDYNNVINNYNINPYDELNNRFNDIQEYDNKIDLTAPEFNIDSESLLQAQELKQIPEAIVDGFIDLKIGYLLFIPLIIGIVRLIL